jgi:hypothetical protein
MDTTPMSMHNWPFKLTVCSGSDSLLEVFAKDPDQADRAGDILRDGFPEMVVTKYSTNGDPPEIYWNRPAQSMAVSRDSQG